MPLHRTLLYTAFALVMTAIAAPGAHAADYAPGEVIVRQERGAIASTSSSTWTGVASATGTQTVSTRPGESVRAAARRISRRPGVAWARPNYIARASAGFIPNDPNFARQWNLTGPYGINMPDAWQLARAAGAPGGRGATVAVLDTGVAYQRYQRYRRAPDLIHFTPGFDFVDGDKHPNDENGHGTHVSGTIAQSTNNGIGTAGIAYRAKIMPVRVLDASGAGDTLTIARGIRYAARRGADVINLSLEFDSSVRGSQIPDIASALRFARRRGSLVVGAAGNQADPVVAYPARARYVMAVSATTQSGCEASYSNSGDQVDLSAPGGGTDAANKDDAYDAAVCRPRQSRPFVYQQTFTSSVRRFGLPGGYEGTSMAAPHVSGVAALVIAAGRLGPSPSPARLEKHLEQTARDIGATGWDERYGWGLLDARAALTLPPEKVVAKGPDLFP